MVVERGTQKVQETGKLSLHIEFQYLPPHATNHWWHLWPRGLQKGREKKFLTFDAWPSCSDKILKQFFDSQLSHRSSDIPLQDKKAHTLTHTHMHTHSNRYTSPHPFPSITLPLSHLFSLSPSTSSSSCSCSLVAMLYFVSPYTGIQDWIDGVMTC